MESTGHYHRLFFHFLRNNSYDVSVVNSIQTDSIKNISVRKVKNDKVDAKKVALLYRLDELKTTNMPDENIENLRCLVRQYYNLVDERTVYKNRLISILFTSALTSIRTNSNGVKVNQVLYDYYQNKCMSKAKKVALVAVMHKLIFIIFAVIRDKKPFELRKPEEHAQMLNNKALQRTAKSA